MSRYVARVVGPSGMETYLAHGREIGNCDAAIHHAHPSGAWRSLNSYLDRYFARRRFRLVGDVIDVRDPERRVM